MSNPGRARVFIYCRISLFFLCLATLFFCLPLLADTNPASSLVVSVEQNQISVQAINASLKETVEKVAHELAVGVEAMISDEERITIEFTNLPWDQAVKQLSQNYASVTDASGVLTKLIFYPVGEDGNSNRASSLSNSKNQTDHKVGSGKSFVFEFDPAKALGEEHAVDQ